MNTSISWSCLSVQKFFSLCNWQGQEKELQEKKLLSLTPKPLNQTSWQCLSVQEFFKLFNEQGQASNHAPSCSFSSPASHSWQCSSVQEFFSHCNWQGQPLESSSRQQAASSRLTEQVREFFQFIPWEGNPEIASLPRSSAMPKPDFSPPAKTTFTDLFELF